MPFPQTATAPGYDLPTGSNVTSGAANTLGTLTQIIASTSAAYYLWGIQLVDLTSNPFYITIELYTGAAGSEILLTKATTSTNSSGTTGGPGFVLFPVPFAIPASTRLSMKAATNLATQTITSAILVLPQSNLNDPTGDTVDTNLDDTITSRLADADYTAPDNTTVSAINAKTTNLPDAPAAVSDIPTANQNADALLNRANGIETGWTPKQVLRIMSAALAGLLGGAPSGPITMRNLPDTKTRIDATVDASGNRTSITYDAG